MNLLKNKQKIFMKMISIIIIYMFIFSFCSVFLVKSSFAYTEQPFVSGEWFYIKNAYSGRYLDVNGGGYGNGVNIHQYEGNQTDAQKWHLFYMGNGEYMIGSMCGSTISNGIRYINYFLDVDGGIDGNGVNIQLWSGNNSNAQRFVIDRTNSWTYILRTKTSNYNKVATVQNAGCSNGFNVMQHQYNASHNDEWILEPININTNFGNYYALTNYNKYVTAYPRLTSMGGDCANFVSQCLLSSGIHYQNDWRVYRINGNYSQPTSVAQLDASWELCAPRTSPWTSAKQFATYWKSQVPYMVLTGQEVLDNAQGVWNTQLWYGDVIQYADKNFLGGLGDAKHTMIITGYGTYNGQLGFGLSYHSGETQYKNLLEICSEKRDLYFIFYKTT